MQLGKQRGERIQVPLRTPQVCLKVQQMYATSLNIQTLVSFRKWNSCSFLYKSCILPSRSKETHGSMQSSSEYHGALLKGRISNRVVCRAPN